MTSVGPQLLTQLMDMGFGEARAGRALLATKKQANVEAALSWIEAHEGDSDIDEPLTAEELAAHKSSKRTPLTEEEAQRLARELQKKLREVRCFFFSSCPCPRGSGRTVDCGNGALHVLGG